MNEYTKEINNLEHIKRLLDFTNPLDFYFIQTIKRKKENPNMPKSERLVNSYFIYSVGDLYDKWEDITNDCIDSVARAYIWLNKRNDERVALETLRLIAENISNQSYKTRNCYLSACGQFNSEENKKWIIDFDNDKDIPYNKNDMRCFLDSIPPIGEKIITEIETPNGLHIITKPFDLRYFRARYPIDVHKDNPTILYYNYTPSIRRK